MSCSRLISDSRRAGSHASPELPTLGIVVCTFQRCDLVVHCVSSLDTQAEEIDRIVVVVDGSTDGTGEALRNLKTTAPLQVIEHENMGAAASRNVGARLLDSDVIYFLDDDMEIVPGSLRARRERHAMGAQVLIGAVPLHPESPETVLSANVGRWASNMADRLDGSDDVSWSEFYMGNTSIERELFFDYRGMRTEFNAQGKWGNSDTELAFRLQEDGVSLSFSRDAAALQNFVVPPRRHINRYFDLGRADVHLARLHPHLAEQRPGNPFSKCSNLPRWLRPWVKRHPGLVEFIGRPMFHLVAFLIAKGVEKPVFNRMAWAFCEIYYWKGVKVATKDVACMG